jgi:MscS family membrane protein
MKKAAVLLVHCMALFAIANQVEAEPPSQSPMKTTSANPQGRNGVQTAQDDQDQLRPADTSSPRDTLLGFLADTTQFIDDYREDRKDERTFRAILRASQALDYSTTPEGDSWIGRGLRVALLQELLARVTLPPASKIPGDHEVASSGITQWTIPGTSITIARILQGPRTGQFLFSAETVQDLDRLYRQAQQAPYQPGATPGIYEDLVRTDAPLQIMVRELRSRLKSVDTASPRSTLEGFLDNVNRAYELASQANGALLATPPTMTREQGREAEDRAANYLQRASETLDLSHVPEAFRKGTGIEFTLLLKEVLDRMLLPPIDVVPTAQMVEGSRRKSADNQSQITNTPFRWTLPDTQIEIVQMLDGERQGQYLFSGSTVRQLREMYDKVKALPYRNPQFAGFELEYASPGLSPGFYETYITSSGYLVPQAHALGRLVHRLPAWFRAVYFSQMVWQWTGLCLVIVLTVLIIYVVLRSIRGMITRSWSPRRDWLRVLAVVMVLLCVRLMGMFINQGLKFTSSVQAVVTTAAATTLYVLAAWAVLLLFKALAETISATPHMRGRTSESALLRIGALLTGFLIAVWVVIVGLRSLGADLIPLLAGLGIGGLAVALAAQSTIANFIGGLILLANKPIRVGDFCRYGEDPSLDWLRIGTVEEITWLSTRIRGIDRTVTTIPNAAFANMHIVNLTKRDQRLVKTVLQVRYETTPDQMRFILMKLRELLLGHPKVTPDPARVRFVGYGAYSKDIEVFCYLSCTEQNEFLAIQEDLLMRMEGVVLEAGSGFAFPSQTAYLTRDAGLDKKRQEEAEAQVGHLRSADKLPFPEFGEEERERLNNILDYPPKGSPDHRSG